MRISYCDSAVISSCGLSGFCFFQAEDGIRDLVRSRGLGDVYKRQVIGGGTADDPAADDDNLGRCWKVFHSILRTVEALSLIHI